MKRLAFGLGILFVAMLILAISSHVLPPKAPLAPPAPPPNGYTSVLFGFLNGKLQITFPVDHAANLEQCHAQLDNVAAQIMPGLPKGAALAGACYPVPDSPATQVDVVPQGPSAAPPPQHEPTLLRGQKTASILQVSGDNTATVALGSPAPKYLDPDAIIYPTPSGYWDFNDPGESGQGVESQRDPLPSRAYSYAILLAHLRFGH